MRVAAAFSGGVDGTGVCADAAVTRGDPSSAVHDHLANDQSDEDDQNNEDQDGPGIGTEPGHGEHLLSALSITDLLRFGNPDFFGQCGGFLIGSEELEAHEAEKRDRDDEADGLCRAGDRETDLIDDQSDGVSKQALIADGEPGPLRVVHLS